MLFSYNWLQSFFNRKLPPPENLAEILTTHSFEVEDVQKKPKDVVLDVVLLPNRAGDCSGHFGLAREISALLNLKILPPPFSLTLADFVDKSLIEVRVEDKRDCPRYVALTISGVKVSSSPQWLKDRLKTCNIQPINNLVDIANYVMLELGQPLHIFDLDKIEGPNSKLKIQKMIEVRRAKNREEMVGLDGKTYKLNPEILIISDSKGPLAIAGIKGGQKAAITQNTKTIVIESANFNPALIRRASKKLGLETDASWRFERGLDPNLALIAAKRAAYLITKIAGGKVSKEIFDFYPVKVYPRKITFSVQKASQLLGLDIKASEAKKIFERLGFNFKFQVQGQKFQVEIPTWRQDLKIQEDLTEEIIRLKGVNKIPSLSLIAQVKALPLDPTFWLEKSLKNTLKNFGFCEIYSYSFLGRSQLEKFYSQKIIEQKVIEVQNPLSSSNQYLRPSVVISLLPVLEKNLRFFDNIKLFEFGKRYYFDNSAQPVEKKTLALAISSIDTEPFYFLKGILENIFESLKFSQVDFEEYRKDCDLSEFLWHPRKTAQILVRKELIGFVGTLSTLASKFLGFKEKVAIAEIDFEKLVRLLPKTQVYVEPSIFPGVKLDIAILVPAKTKAKEVQEVIKKSAGKLLKECELFDIYQGPKVPSDTKSLAFHLTYLSDKKTLTAKEVEILHQKVIKALEKNPKWKIR